MKVNSSVIKEIFIAAEGSEDPKLIITFKTDKVYCYSGIPEQMQNDFMKAESVGKFYNEFIKDTGDSQKL